MDSLILVTPPAGEPVSVSDMMIQLGMGALSDSSLSTMLTTQLSGFIMAARDYCESYMRRVCLTQTWTMNLDGFPGVDVRYNDPWRRHAIMLPKQPFQSIVSVNYIDVNGIPQVLAQDTSYGNDILGEYAYQLDPGGETQPARIAPAWLVPWPLTRRVQAAVQITFAAGYGGPITASMVQGSAILTGPVFLAGDVGQAICVPGAGASGVPLATTIESVDGNGQATLNATAATAVANVTAWAGKHVPPPILQAIKFMAQFFYEQGSVVDVPIPRVIMALLDPYRNLVS
jgi:hypothetical protein